MIISALKHNWELKVLSIGIACGLWAFVMSRDTSRIAVASPVEYVGLGPDMVLVDTPPATVDVEVQARRWAVASLDGKRVKVRLNLAEVHEGETLLQLTPDLVTVPPGVTVTRITPARVRLEAVRTMTGAARVVARVRGTPPRGHVVRAITVEPPSVEVTAPRWIVERGTIDTVPVDVSGRRAAFTRDVGLSLSETAGTVRPTTVRVLVDIQQEDAMGQGKKGDAR